MESKERVREWKGKRENESWTIAEKHVSESNSLSDRKKEITHDILRMINNVNVAFIPTSSIDLVMFSLPAGKTTGLLASGTEILQQ